MSAVFTAYMFCISFAPTHAYANADKMAPSSEYDTYNLLTLFQRRSAYLLNDMQSRSTNSSNLTVQKTTLYVYYNYTSKNESSPPLVENHSGVALLNAKKYPND